MKQTLLQEKYPVFVAEIGKDETTCKNVEDVTAYLKARIAEKEKVTFIGVFDHYAHTKAIGGEINPDIQAAVDVIFCFGFALPNPQVLAVRPPLHRRGRHGRQIRRQLPGSANETRQRSDGGLGQGPARRLTTLPLPYSTRFFYIGTTR